MKRQINTILTICLALNISSFAEECPQFIPQAPEAQAVARSIDYPVNLYTGVPEISIPIYEIKLGSITVPITLDYQSGGIVPSQEATSVGLGWRLNVGGTITRTVKCADDFLERFENYDSQYKKKFFWQYNQDNAKDITNCLKINHSDETLIADSEPDIYYYSIPGNSGKFTHNRSGEVIYFDKSKNVKVLTDFDNYCFELLDANGNTYCFEKYAKDTVYTYSFKGALPGNNWSINTLDAYDILTENSSDLELKSMYSSCWNLTKIISPTYDTLYFEYTSIAYQLPLQETCSKENVVLWGPSNFPYYEPWENGVSPTTKYQRCKTSIRGFQLSAIKWRGGCVKFVEDKNSRKDLAYSSRGGLPHAISRIEVFAKPTTNGAKEDSSAYRCHFTYDYFNNEVQGNFSHLFKRLKLNKFSSDNEEYVFSYYDDVKMPVKNTKNTDYWGYYNGKQQGKEYYCSAVNIHKESDEEFARDYSVDGWYTSGQTSYSGANKDADERYCKVGILEKITNASGGTTKFNYECHRTDVEESNNEFNPRFFQYVEDSVGGNHAMNTLNVSLNKKTLYSLMLTTYSEIGLYIGWNSFCVYQINDDGTESLVYNFLLGLNKRSSVNVLLEPGQYKFKVNASIPNVRYIMVVCEEDIHGGSSEIVCGGGLRIKSIEGEQTLRYEYHGGKELLGRCTFFYREQQYEPLNDAYDWFSLQKVLVQNSEPIRPFSSFKNGVVIGYSVVDVIRSDGSKTQYTYHNEKDIVQNYFYPYSPAFTDWENGQLLSMEQYDAIGTLVSETRNTYTIKDKFIMQDIGFIKNPYENPFFYDVRVDYPVLSKTVRIERGTPVTTKKFEYNDKFLLSKEFMKYGVDSCGVDTYVKQYKYPFEFSDNVNRRLSYLLKPIVTISSRNGTVYDVNRVVYGFYGNLDFKSKNVTLGNSDTWFMNSKGSLDLYQMILPAYQLKLNTTIATEDLERCTYDTVVSYDSYTFNGLPQEFHYKGTPITYLWGYKGQFPIAEFKNATFAQVSARVPDIGAFYKGNGLSENLKNSLSYTSIDGASTTICQYKPFVGLMSIVDNRGISYEYNYDYCHRLKQSFLCGNNENKSSISPILLKSYEYEKGHSVTTTTYLNGRSVFQGSKYSPNEDFATYIEGSSTNNIVSKQYYDQWGRPSLTAFQGANPSGAYSYGLQTYDELGRTSKSWVGIPTEDTQAQCLSDDDFAQQSSSAFNDEYGYSQTEYDALGRVVKTTTPGKSWHDADKATICQYQVNTANEVKRYVVSGNSLTQNQYYPTGSLECIVTTDPDGHIVKNYKDVFGNVVLERRGSNVYTYFVYDDYNRLRFVLQPMYQAEANLDKFAFQYTYDVHGRVVSKKLPGCQPITYEYDKSDRVIKMQDGLLRAKGKFRTYEYDGLGRLVSQGVSDGESTEYDVQNYYDEYDFIADYEYLMPNHMWMFEPYETLYGKGQLTGTWQKASNGEELLTTYGYNEYGQMECKSELGLDNHVSMMEYQYNYAGDVKKEWFTEYKYTLIPQHYNLTLFISS